MNCPKCQARIPAEDINVQALIGKCPKCGEVFRVDEELGENDSLPKHDEIKTPKPDNIVLEDDGSVRRISFRWFRGMFVVLLFFCIFWIGFLVFWYSMAFGRGSPLIVKLFPVLHVAVGVLLTYSTLCGFINRTVIEVTDDSITVRHGPLPWPGNQTLSAPEVGQIYCDETISRGRNNTTASYNVNALVSDERSVKLLSSLSDKQMALFIEQQLEEWLKIKPRHVKGAIS